MWVRCPQCEHLYIASSDTDVSADLSHAGQLTPAVITYSLSCIYGYIR